MRFPEDDSSEPLQSFRQFAEYGSLSDAERGWIDGSAKFWRDARYASGFSREVFQRKIGIKKQDLTSFENGTVPQAVYYGDIPRRYAEALGNPELYQVYCQQFNIPIPDPEIFGK